MIITTVLNNFIFENLAVYEIMWKNIVERGRPQMIVWCTDIACWVVRATDKQTYKQTNKQIHTHTHTHRFCNIHFFPPTTTVARKPLNVTSYARWLSCLRHCYVTRPAHDLPCCLFDCHLQTVCKAHQTSYAIKLELKLPERDSVQ